MLEIEVIEGKEDSFIEEVNDSTNKWENKIANQQHGITIQEK